MKLLLALVPSVAAAAFIVWIVYSLAPAIAYVGHLLTYHVK